MSKIVRYEFMGSWWIFWGLCVTVVGLPVAFLYFVNGTLRVENDLENPEEFVSRFRASKRGQ